MAKKTKTEFVKWFGPLLDALRDLGDSGRPREVSDKIAKNLNLPDTILDETLKSGGSKFHNQVAWARQYLVWEGYLDASKHGTWKLTANGRNASISEEEAHKIFLKWVAVNQNNRKSKESAEKVQNQIAIIIDEIPPEDNGSDDLTFERWCCKALSL